MSFYTISEIYSAAERLTTEKIPLTVRGWVRSHRSGAGGKLQFVQISDGSTIKDVQVVYEGEHSKIDYMASVEIEGLLVDSPAKGQDHELQATQITVVGECPPDSFPLPRKKLPMTVLRQYPHLRMRTKTMQAIMRVRHQMWMSVMSFFHKAGYISMHTPLITFSDCEGAGEAFKVDGGKDFFRKSASLTVSGQLEGEMAATALGKIFTCGPTFRAEHSDTPRHLSEFWMVEPEMAWHDLDDTITVAKDLITHCVQDAMRLCPDELDFLRDTPLELPEYKCITYTEAIEILRGDEFKVACDGLPTVEWGDDLGTPHERFLSDTHFKCPVIITHYPREMKAFYMHQDPSEDTVACFDLLLPGVGEAIGGSQREVRLDVLEKEMERRGMGTEEYQDYLDLRRFGSVPHSGFGLGFARLVRYVTGVEHIRDVVPFPRYYQSM